MGKTKPKYRYITDRRATLATPLRDVEIHSGGQMPPDARYCLRIELRRDTELVHREGHLEAPYDTRCVGEMHPRLRVRANKGRPWRAASLDPSETRCLQELGERALSRHLTLSSDHMGADNPVTAAYRELAAAYGLDYDAPGFTADARRVRVSPSLLKTWLSKRAGDEAWAMALASFAPGADDDLSGLKVRLMPGWASDGRA